MWKCLHLLTIKVEKYLNCRTSSERLLYHRKPLVGLNLAIFLLQSSWSLPLLTPRRLSLSTRRKAPWDRQCAFVARSRLKKKIKSINCVLFGDEAVRISFHCYCYVCTYQSSNKRTLNKLEVQIPVTTNAYFSLNSYKQETTRNLSTDTRLPYDMIISNSNKNYCGPFNSYWLREKRHCIV